MRPAARPNARAEGVRGPGERELEAEDEAALAEQERIAREIQDKLEQDEAADMAAIRAAQAKDGMPTPAPAPATAIAPAATSSAAVENAAGKRLSEATQKRLSLDPDTWNLVLQLSDMVSVMPSLVPSGGIISLNTVIMIA